MAKLSLESSTLGISMAAPDDPGNIVLPARVGEATTSGKALYFDTTAGTVKIADASDAAKQQFCGLALETKGLGQGVSRMVQGLVAGYDLSGLAFGALVYLDTTGDLATAANATKTVVVGKVVGTGKLDSTGAVRKLLFISMSFFADY